MKAVVFENYGSPDVLQLKEIDKPEPKDDEVLVKVFATSINDWDWGMLRGVPFVNRLMAGVLRPGKIKILGCDVAGVIEAVGCKVTKLQPGDEVFGDLCESGFGAFAEYVCAPETALALKPASMSFEQAAAIPQAGLLALHGIYEKGQVQPGQKVLINGAGGGTGSFALQMAKSSGAEVTGVDNTEKLDFMRSSGADFVIDFTKEDFTKNGQQYDFILDLMGFHSISDYKSVLKPKGIYTMVGGSNALAMKAIFFGPLLSLTGNKKVSLMMHKPNKELGSIIALFETGKVLPMIDKTFPLCETAKALHYFGEGHCKGKVVITTKAL